MSNPALKQQESSGVKGIQREQTEAQQTSGRYDSNILSKDLSDDDFQKFFRSSTGRARGDVTGFPPAANLLPSEQSKIGKAPDGSTVTENPDGTSTVNGINIDGKSYNIDFANRNTNGLPTITDSQGQVVPFLDGSAVTPLGSKIENQAISDKQDFDAQSKLDNLNLRPTEKQDVSSMAEELKTSFCQKLCFEFLN